MDSPEELEKIISASILKLEKEFEKWSKEFGAGFRSNSHLFFTKYLLSDIVNEDQLSDSAKLSTVRMYLLTINKLIEERLHVTD